MSEPTRRRAEATDPYIAAVAATVLPEAHTTVPVPESETVSGVQVGMVCIGIAITLPALYTGGAIATGLGLGPGLLAVLLAAALLSVMSVPSALMGVRTRLTSYMIIEHVFGWLGAKIVNACLAVTLLGWYAVTAELFGRTLGIAAGEYLDLALPEWLWILASSAVVTLTTIFGFKALDRLALVAVPLLILFLSWVMLEALGQRPLTELLALPGDGMGFTEGVSILIGAMIVNVVLMPDLARYARRGRDAFVAACLGNGGGIVVATILAMIPALAFDVLDPMRHFAAVGVGFAALLALVFATWTTNGVNLYSTSLVAGSAFRRLRYGPITLMSSVLGTALALWGVADRLTDFLIVLGLVVPPVAGVYLSRFFLLGRRDFDSARLAERPAIEVLPFGACMLAGGMSLWAWTAGVSATGILPVESLILAAVLYLGAERVFGRGRQDRPA